ncbi:hypothetical protein KCU98_g2717, partial [Aureobasidium melanogenum]
MDQNNHNNTIFGSTSISNLTHGQHTENPTSSSETSPSSIFRPHLDALPLSLITLPDGFPEFTASYPEIEYTVPESVFAESCPVCDEMAMESIEEGFIARYPRGWVLVACQRHVGVLRTSSGGTHVCVGGQLELRSKAALRLQERELKRSEEKAVEKRAAAANTAAAAAAAAAATSAAADKHYSNTYTTRSLSHLPSHSTNPPPLLHPHFLHPLPNALANHLLRHCPLHLALLLPLAPLQIPNSVRNPKVKIYMSDVQSKSTVYETE